MAEVLPNQDDLLEIINQAHYQEVVQYIAANRDIFKRVDYFQNFGGNIRPFRWNIPKLNDPLPDSGGLSTLSNDGLGNLGEYSFTINLPEIGPVRIQGMRVVYREES